MLLGTSIPREVCQSGPLGRIQRDGNNLGNTEGTLRGKVIVSHDGSFGGVTDSPGRLREIHVRVPERAAPVLERAVADFVKQDLGLSCAASDSREETHVAECSKRSRYMGNGAPQRRQPCAGSMLFTSNFGYLGGFAFDGGDKLGDRPAQSALLEERLVCGASWGGQFMQSPERQIESVRVSGLKSGASTSHSREAAAA